MWKTAKEFAPQIRSEIEAILSFERSKGKRKRIARCFAVDAMPPGTEMWMRAMASAFLSPDTSHPRPDRRTPSAFAPNVPAAPLGRARAAKKAAAAPRARARASVLAAFFL